MGGWKRVHTVATYATEGLMLGKAGDKVLVYLYFIVLTVCVSVCHGCDALLICGPISACILSASVTLPDFDSVMLPPTIYSQNI